MIMGAWRMGEKRLPYDAEVEYLYTNPVGGNSSSSHSSGAAIDTGVIPSSDLVVRLRVMFLPLNVWGNVFGVEDSDSSPDSYRLRRDSRSSKLAFNIGTSGVVSYNYAENAILDIECGNKYITINGTTVTGPYSVESSQSRTLCLCCVRRAGKLIDYSNMRIYSTKLMLGNNLIRDFVPVRKGNVGYMYDRVSGQLFHNQGTGSFVIGPDK